MRQLSRAPFTATERSAIERFVRDSATLPAFTVATIPSAIEAGVLIYVSNEAGGAVVAFSDGTNWRRVTDRAIIS